MQKISGKGEAWEFGRLKLLGTVSRTLSRPVPHSRLPGTSSSLTRPSDTGAPSPPLPHSLAWPKTRPSQRLAGSQLCSTGFARRKTGPWAEPGAPPSGSAFLSELVFALKQFRPSGKLASLEMEADSTARVISGRDSGSLLGVCLLLGGARNYSWARARHGDFSLVLRGFRLRLRPCSFHSKQPLSRFLRGGRGDVEEQVVEAGRRGTHLQLFRRPAQGCPPPIEQAEVCGKATNPHRFALTSWCLG